MPNKNFDCRAFLKGAALAGVAPAVQAAPPVRKWDHESNTFGCENRFVLAIRGQWVDTFTVSGFQGKNPD